MAEHVEIAVLGSGPGGLGAATNAARQGVSHVMIEKSEIANTIYEYQLRKLVMDEPTRLPLRCHVPFVEGSRENVLGDFEKAIKATGVNVVKGEVTKIQKDGNNFTIVHSNGEYTAKNVVLAIGTMGTPRKLGVSGEDQPHIAYTLADPDAFTGKNIIVVGAGDSAIENALALAEKNSVSILNRSGEFPRAKDANRTKILDAIDSGAIRCFYSSTMARIDADTATINRPEGEVTVDCNHIIVRAGSIPPRKFVESCGVVFPSPDIVAVPSVSNSYESNVPGLYIIGALIGYPLIKQALNQGFETVEHMLGNPVEPADQVLIDEVFEPLEGIVNENLAAFRKTLRLFVDLSTPQFREMMIDSKIVVTDPGEEAFKRNDYSDTFWHVVSGSVGVELGEKDLRFNSLASSGNSYQVCLGFLRSLVGFSERSACSGEICWCVVLCFLKLPRKR